jgi:hypothetical protein
MKKANKKTAYWGRIALAVLALLVSVQFVSLAMPPQGGESVAASTCSLPVVSTVVLEYPLGSPQVTATLTSTPDDLPTVYTAKESLTTQSMDSIFVALNLSGTFNGQPIKSVLNGEFPSKGKVENVRHTSKGKFAGGHHVLQVFQVYTIGTVSFFNKQPIVLAADITSETPAGRTYTKHGAAAVSLYDKTNPTKVVAKLYSLSNKVQ